MNIHDQQGKSKGNFERNKASYMSYMSWAPPCPANELLMPEQEITNDKAIADQLVRSSNHCSGNIDTLSRECHGIRVNIS